MTDETTTGGTRVDVDLTDRISEIDARIGQLHKRLESAGEGGSGDDSDPVSENEGDEGEVGEGRVKRKIAQLEHAIELLESDIDRFGGSTVTIKKFRAGETARVNDLVVQDTLRDDLEDPRAKLSARKLRTVQVGVVDLPEDAPDDPSQFENPTFEYLWECIDNLNTYGEVSLADF